MFFLHLYEKSLVLYAMLEESVYEKLENIETKSVL